ncbi:hypothetical protein GGD81_004575 [Rhodobium orientis]|uniref:DUF2207 domain-containing protein n=1 Tax=Rhodobium orientis TaxID=34017 RepID=A0A327JMU3_9HYPH|nr:DUF2207 domain-containing protein [Rhodobium orientis]MBB4305495.1 hypothetical protein [Rhodobium orientis]MBK5949865.1 hypothetical protein [Rhodobium orientis]RAI24738.1 hypothetical protein CH339_21460 [Rhodobium orientis]
MIRHILALCIISPLFAACSATAEEEILSFESDIVLSEDGALDVTDTIRVRSKGYKMKEGVFYEPPYVYLYREFQVEYKDADVAHPTVGLDILDVRKDGNAITYQARQAGSNVFVSSRNIFPAAGVHTYEFRYRTRAHILCRADQELLYWKVVSNNWDFPILKTKARITLPASLAARLPETLIGLVESKGIEGRIARRGPNAIAFNTTRTLPSGEAFAVRIAFEKGTFADCTDRHAMRGGDSVDGSNSVAGEQGEN